MTAPLFDAEAIARRVFDAEHAAVEEQAEPAPAVVDTPYIAGSGQTRGRPLPTEATGDGSDLFDRLERQRAAKAVRSPIVLRDLPFEPTARTRAERAALEERYVAPPLVEDDDPADLHLPHGPNCQEYGCTLHAEPAPVEPEHDPRCGTPLTGGGAPRGWVLVRIIGHGAPRRWCTPECAINALIAHAKITTPRATPERTRRLEQRAATIVPRPRPTRRGPVSTLDVREIVRRYQDGQTAPDIGRDLGHTAKTIRDALDRAGIQRRDDRSTRSGGGNRVDAYPAELVAQVSRLYIEQGMSQLEVAQQLGITTKVVQNVMAKHEIPTRPKVTRKGLDHGPGAATKRRMEQITAVGATTAGVRAWAALHGMACGDRGCPPQAVIDAFLDARGVTDEPDERTTA